MSDGTALGPLTFVVRIHHDPDGRVRGVVERVATREKEAFDEPGQIGAIIARLVDSERQG